MLPFTRRHCGLRVMSSQEDGDDTDDERERRARAVVSSLSVRTEREEPQGNGFTKPSFPERKGPLAPSGGLFGVSGGRGRHGRVSVRDSLRQREPRRDPAAEKMADMLFFHLDRNFAGWQEEEKEEREEEAKDVPGGRRNNAVRLFVNSPVGVLLAENEHLESTEKKTQKKSSCSSSTSGSDDSVDRKRALDSVLVELQAEGILPPKRTKREKKKRPEAAE